LTEVPFYYILSTILILRSQGLYPLEYLCSLE
jgi:hypothetical protein